MTERRLTTLAHFAEWLRAQPDDTTYAGPPSYHCPIAVYVGERFPSVCFQPVPDWAFKFMANFDISHYGKPTQRHALLALNKTEILCGSAA